MERLLRIRYWNEAILAVENILSNLDKNKSCLFLFDIDDVLLKINGIGSSSWFYHQIKEYPLETLENAYTLFLLENPATVTDSVVPDFINKIQNAGHDTVALTARSSKQLTSTMRDLHNCGIKLDKNSNFDYKLNGYSHCDNNLFINNIFFSAGKNKGLIAKSLIENKSYDHIFFFDDELRNIERVLEHVNNVTAFNIYGYRQDGDALLSKDISLTEESEITKEVIEIIKKIRNYSV